MRGGEKIVFFMFVLVRVLFLFGVGLFGVV